MIDQAMLTFVQDYARLHNPVGTTLKQCFPFRQVVDHCVRCVHWARRIQSFEGGELNIIETSVLFHDIGKCLDVGKREHGWHSARLCQEYLASINYDRNRAKAIVSIVRHHTEHCSGRERSLEAQIASDSDLLDETGAMVVLWDCLGLPEEVMRSYTEAYQKIDRNFRASSGEPLFFTATGRMLYHERRRILKTFLQDLRFELGLDDHVVRACEREKEMVVAGPA